MLDSDEEDEGEGLGGEQSTGREPAGVTLMGEEEELSNDAENFSHVSHQLDIFVGNLYLYIIYMYTMDENHSIISAAV